MAAPWQGPAHGSAGAQAPAHGSADAPDDPSARSKRAREPTCKDTDLLKSSRKEYQRFRYKGATH